MSRETALAFGAGAGIAAVAALAGFLRLRRATKSGGVGPPALLQATALRFALTLAGALGLALGWREQAVPALAGLAVTYLALLAIETRWSIGMVGSLGSRKAREAPRGKE